MTDNDNSTSSARQNWLDFLQQQGAAINDGIVTDFTAQDTSVAPETATLCALTSRGVIQACGDEAQPFLQNQFCNNVLNVNDSTSQLNGYCTPKGRLLAVFRLWMNHGCYHLGLPRERLPATLKRLQMFVLMSKVDLSDVSDDIVTIGLSGSDAEAILQANALGEISVPQNTDEAVSFDGITCIRVPGTVTRFEISGPVPAIQSLWQQLAPRCYLGGESAWQIQDIHAGIPQVVESTAEAFVPQMVNMELVNGLSFKKGCYPGQEIVARTHYLGKQKRRMYLAHIDTTTPPRVGDSIVSRDDQSGQAVGTIVNAAPSANGGIDLLAVLQIAKAKSGGLALADGQKPQLILKDLPYSVEDEESVK